MAARLLVHLVPHSCYAGLQLAVTKHIGTAAQRRCDTPGKRGCSWRLLNAL